MKARKPRPSPGAFDMRAGRLLRIKREASGLGRTAISAIVGIRHQQISKYERGASALSIERLHQFASAIGFDAGEFMREVAEAGYLSGPASENEVTAARLMVAARGLKNTKDMQVLLFLAKRFAGDSQPVLIKEREAA